MSVGQRELQIKIMPMTVPETDSDRALFAVFDFLLADKPQQITEHNIEKLKLPNNDYEKRISQVN